MSAIALSWLHRVEKGAGLLAPTRVGGCKNLMRQEAHGCYQITEPGASASAFRTWRKLLG